MVDPVPVIAPNDRQYSTQRPMLGIALRLTAMAILGVMFALVKLAGEAGVHVTESLFWRQLAGLPVVMIWLWWNGDLQSVQTRQPMMHGQRMILGLSAMLLNFLAMTMLPLAEATTIGFATPIIATMLAALLLREPTGWYRWAAVFIGFAGVLIAMWPAGNSVTSVGTLIAVGGAIMTASVSIQLRRMTKTEATGAIVFWFSLMSLIPLGIAMLFFAKAHDSYAWMLIFGLSTAGAAAQILLTSSLRHAPVAAILTMDYSGLIWSILFGYFIFDNVPGLNVWFGAPIIVSAGLFIAWREHRLANKTVKNA
jgi:drug/metabolite transporter (DMT)-like permease